MRLTSGVLPTVGALVLSGCASTITAIFERSVQSERMPRDQDPFSVLTMTGERRLAVSGARAIPYLEDTDNRMKICAESLPDAARAAAATSSLAAATAPAAGGQRSLEVSDAFATALIQTFARTETSDVVRQLGWQLCLAYVNGAIDRTQYNTQLTMIVNRAFDVMEKRPTTAGTDKSGSTVKAKAPAATTGKKTAPKSNGETPKAAETAPAG